MHLIVWDHSQMAGCMQAHTPGAEIRLSSKQCESKVDGLVYIGLALQMEQQVDEVDGS